MKVFITGASGFIGNRLATKLAKDNHDVTVLLRDPSKAAGLAGTGIKIIHGDLFSNDQLNAGMENCDWVFHLAAFTKPFSEDPELPYRINVKGTLNILQAAKNHLVRKVIITSSAGTMGFSTDGLPVSETSVRKPSYHTEYERTKAEAERIALEFNSDKFNVIVVNPTRVYGPGILGVSNSVTRIVRLYGKGLWRIVPGDGNASGNYVFIDDVVQGHILAAMHGKGGEKYILGGENLTYSELFNILGDIYGNRRVLIKIPAPVIRGIVKGFQFWAKAVSKPPVITNEWTDKYLQNWIMTSSKAEKDLNYRITPFREGASKTIEWLRSGRM